MKEIVCWRTQTKTYHMVDDEEEMLQRAEGTDIQWASGKNPTVKVGIWARAPLNGLGGRMAQAVQARAEEVMSVGRDGRTCNASAIPVEGCSILQGVEIEARQHWSTSSQHVRRAARVSLACCVTF